MAQNPRQEHHISIQMAQNGYSVWAPTATTASDGSTHLTQTLHVFARDVHVIKFIKDLLPQLEAME